ncbi:hypothetical protein [Candidatus Uabimicrobium amorphum]|uniref:Uncharacterized protein n=1 Tax=Uabimicrobium amorphum TaxID=2596890 RepID=A0A5S9IIH3_UABAM|nr:hypothetical protein [Candidatus Uabimicrobium amorphum]BBM81680.1 hypothetical protein UABAM_00019 [Candidatus Uabimicrobium amorphum]
MSSTNKQQAEKFFTKYLSNVLKSSPKKEFFPMQPNEKQDSYYKKRTDNFVTRDHFKCYAKEDFGGALQELWKNEHQLKDLSTHFAKLAEELKKESLDEEVSSFVYAMF